MFTMVVSNVIFVPFKYVDVLVLFLTLKWPFTDLKIQVREYVAIIQVLRISTWACTFYFTRYKNSSYLYPLVTHDPNMLKKVTGELINWKIKSVSSRRKRHKFPVETFHTVPGYTYDKKISPFCSFVTAYVSCSSPERTR